MLNEYWKHFKSGTDVRAVAMDGVEGEPLDMTDSGMIGIGWASTGGESSAILNERYLAADGIENCIRVLDQIDNSDITNLDFIELNACSGGCVGGAMTVANPYIAQARLQSLKRYLPVSPNRPAGAWIPDEFFNEKGVEYNPYARLSADRHTAMRMMSEIEEITGCLPGLDCGSCGSPSCRALAEDIVRGHAKETDCIFKLREKISKLVDEMVALENPTEKDEE